VAGVCSLSYSVVANVAARVTSDQMRVATLVLDSRCHVCTGDPQFRLTLEEAFDQLHRYDWAWRRAGGPEAGFSYDSAIRHLKHREKYLVAPWREDFDRRLSQLETMHSGERPHPKY
jgi:hypothetical protein